MKKKFLKKLAALQLAIIIFFSTVTGSYIEANASAEAAGYAAWCLLWMLCQEIAGYGIVPDISDQKFHDAAVGRTYDKIIAYIETEKQQQLKDDVAALTVSDVVKKADSGEELTEAEQIFYDGICTQIQYTYMQLISDMRDNCFIQSDTDDGTKKALAHLFEVFSLDKVSDENGKLTIPEADVRAAIQQYYDAKLYDEQEFKDRLGGKTVFTWVKDFLVSKASFVKELAADVGKVLKEYLARVCESFSVNSY